MLNSYTVLTNELNTDPLSLGYKVAGVFKDDVTLAGLLNQSRGTILIPTGIIDTRRVLESIAASDLSALTVARLTIVLALVSNAVINMDSPNIRALLALLFPSATAPTTNASLVALQTRSGSRVEQLYSPGTAVTHTDVAIALGRL